jgi:hypothetical protein
VRRPAPADVLSALPDFAIAGSFLVTWIAPSTFGATMVKHLMMVMLLEFLIVHSAAFMGKVSVGGGGRGAKAGALVGLGVFYSLFAGAFSLAMRSWWPITAFWGLMVNRLTTVLFGGVPDERAEQAVMTGWGLGAASYLGAVAVTAMAPVPALGISPAVIAAQHFTAGGLWVSEPQRVLAAGLVYFAAVGCVELFVLPRVGRGAGTPAPAWIS